MQPNTREELLKIYAIRYIIIVIGNKYDNVNEWHKALNTIADENPKLAGEKLYEALGSIPLQRTKDYSVVELRDLVNFEIGRLEAFTERYLAL